MMLALILAWVSVAILAVTVERYRRAWNRERDGRLAIHRARILDNDQRSVDNERWAERVAQARALGQEAVAYAAIVEGKAAAGAVGESPAQHVRNALSILMIAPADDQDGPVVTLEQADVVAIKSRLWTAINALERR